MSRTQGARNFRARFRVVPSSSEQHPLHLTTSNELMKLICPSVEDESAVVCIKRKFNDGIFSGGDGVCDRHRSDPLFVCLHVARGRLNESSVDVGGPDCGEQAVTLRCSKTFLDHYGFSVNDTVYVRCITPHPLSNVVIAAKSVASFNWAKRPNFASDLLLLTCQKKVLVRKGDVLLAPYVDLFNKDLQFHPSFFFDLEILACDPLNQGIFSINTGVTVLSLVESITKSPSSPLALQNVNNRPTVSESKFTDLIYASDFATVLNTMHDKENLNKSESLYLLGLETQENPQSGVKMTPVTVKSEFEWMSMFSEPKNKSSLFDSNNWIGMSKLTVQQLGLFDGSIVKLRVDGCCKTKTNSVSVSEDVEDTTTETQLNSKHNKEGDEAGVNSQTDKSLKTTESFHLAQLKVIKETAKQKKSGCFYLTPALWFNLTKKPLQSESHIHVEKWQEDPALLKAQNTSTSFSWSGSIPYATELHIRLINSPHYTVTSAADAALEKFFRIPRIFKEGDVFTVSTRGDSNFYNSTTEKSDTRYPIMHFIVSKLVSKVPRFPAYIADTSHTTLLQIGTEHNFIPVTMETFLSVPKLHPVWHSSDPAGLQKYVAQIINILSPYLSSRCTDLVPSLLLTGPSGCGKNVVITAVSRHANMHSLKVDCHDLCGDTSSAVEAKISAAFHRANSYSPCLLHLENIHVLGRDRDGISEDSRVASFFHAQTAKLNRKTLNSTVVVIATAQTSKALSTDMLCGFLHHIQMEVPDASERRDLLRGLLHDVAYSEDVSVDHLVQRTAGMVLGDLAALVVQSLTAAYSRVVSACGLGHFELSGQEEEDVRAAGFSCTAADFSTALDYLQSMHSDTIGAPKIPNVSWEDIGGLAEVKAAILDTIQLPLQHPELFEAGLRRSGVLLYGPPGTGKTLLAKAVATECALNFLSVKGPELLNMYVGQSEENVREVFNRARSATPCVIFFDELDSLAPNRGRSGDSGGVMDRVVSQLLAELDGLHKAFDVFVIGATNRPDLLDPALLRPGRFDKLLYLGVSDDKEAQLKVLQALTRKFKLMEDCDLRHVADICPYNLTGADFYALCSDAMLNALKGKIELLNKGEEVDQSCVPVCEEDFMTALQNLVPSVSHKELLYYKQLQKTISADSTARLTAV